MPKLKYPRESLRLSREALNVLDEISEELGDLSRRSTVEILARFVKGLKVTTGLRYTDVLLKTNLLDEPGFPHFDRRRKPPVTERAALSSK